MDVRVTPISISRFTTSKKCKPGTPSVYQQKRISPHNTGHTTALGDTNQNVLVTKRNRLDKPQTFNTSKRINSNNNLLLVSKKGASKPRVFLKVIPNIHQSATVPAKKKVLLYQQIERNKLLENNSELVNRFNYKV